MSLHEKRAAEIREQVRIAAWKKAERAEKAKAEYEVYQETYGDASRQKTGQVVRKAAPIPCPQWSVILGVHFPCTHQEAKQARDILFKKVHPDQGGTNEDFIRAKKAWDEAVVYFRNRP